MFKNELSRSRQINFHLWKINFRDLEKKYTSTRNFLCARYSMWFLLVFNSATFSKTIELFTLLFGFFHVHDANVHFSLLNFSFRFRVQLYTLCFFSNRQARCCSAKYRKIFIGKLYFGLPKDKRQFLSDK